MATRTHGGPLASLRTLRLLIHEGPDAGLRWEGNITRPISVGTSSDNDMVLTDPSVSRYHLELVRGANGVVVRDLGSSNGTRCGDAMLMEAIVGAGTRLRLGASVLEVGDGTRATAGDPVQPIEGLIAESRVMKDVVRRIRAVAPSSANVLLQGETGTGKEVVARAIHDLSARRTAPFVVVDCGSMPATLVASQLLGHEKGAFTGASRQRQGAFERAHGGTLFLDEIGELPLSVQPALLGVLERSCFNRVGGNKSIQVDVRVISATHRELRSAANEGSFRADLYFRLAVARIHLPPLRARPEDLELLVQHFARELTGQEHQAPFGPTSYAALRAHPWSGNIRELRNVVESALAMGELDLGVSPQIDRPVLGANLPIYRDAKAEAVRVFEATYLRTLIESCEGNACEAARRAKMDRPYLLTLLRRHGLR